MGLFGRHKKETYDYDSEDSRNYEEFDTGETPDEAIARLKGTISKGDCYYCGTHNSMKYEGNICFICDRCNNSVHEDFYYLWVAGFPVETIDER